MPCHGPRGLGQAAFGHLVDGSQVDHRAQPKRIDVDQIGLGEPVQSIGAEELPPADRTVIPASVAPQVAEVPRPLEVQAADRIGTGELGTGELGTSELGTSELGTSGLGTSELGAGELGAGGIRFTGAGARSVEIGVQVAP